MRPDVDGPGRHARLANRTGIAQGEAGRYTFDDDAPFGLPYRPTPFYVQVTLSLGPNTSEVFAALPVQFRYEGDIFSGEKRSDLLVVPALSVRVSPEVAIVPIAHSLHRRLRRRRRRPAAAAVPQPAPAPPRPPAAGRGRGAAAPTPPPAPATSDTREVRVTVVNDTKGEVESVVALEVPAGWTATPAEQTVAFTREDESQTVRFQLRAAAGRGARRVHGQCARLSRRRRLTTAVTR